VAGWQQIFFYDPDGNIIEVHQATTWQFVALETWN
jgi:catechol-2,3-dioxygenase